MRLRGDCWPTLCKDTPAGWPKERRLGTLKLKLMDTHAPRPVLFSLLCVRGSKTDRFGLFLLKGNPTCLSQVRCLRVPFQLSSKGNQKRKPNSMFGVQVSLHPFSHTHCPMGCLVFVTLVGLGEILGNQK